MDARICTVLDTIESVKALIGCFQINKHQCKRLAECYSKAGEFFDQLSKLHSGNNEAVDHSSQRLPAYSLPSLDVTISVLLKGQVLLEKYADKEKWLDNMITDGVNRDSFVAIHLELGPCIRLIHDAVVNQGLLASSRLQVPSLMSVGEVVRLHFLDENDRATLFEGDADKDAKFMHELIERSKILSKNARIKNHSMDQKSFEALNMASEKISKSNNINQLQSGPQTQLPADLNIDPSDIEFFDQIGTGGSASVHRGRWHAVECAVKIFNAGDSSVERLRKEVETLITLRHPNVVPLYGFSVGKDSDANKPMVVMELLESDLYTLIRSGDIEVVPNTTKRGSWRQSTEHQLDPLPIRVAIDFIYQIAAGMYYIHKKKIFHADLKAKNVLVKGHLASSGLNEPRKWRYELKISDFGVSKKLVIMNNDHISGNQSDHPSFRAANIGTLRWRAPEVFPGTDGDPILYSQKADVYSFAMTCVEIVTRQVPFYAIESPAEIKTTVLAGGRPELPPHVPEDLRKLIVRCWDPEPKSRPGFSEICNCIKELKDPPLQPAEVKLTRSSSKLNWLSSCYTGSNVAN